MKNFPRSAAAFLLLSLLGGLAAGGPDAAAQTESPPPIQFKEPLIGSMPAPADAAPAPGITPLAPQLGEAPTPPSATLLDELRAKNIPRAAEMLGDSRNQAALLRDAASFLPPVIQTGDRDLLVQFLQLQPQGLLWQGPAESRMLQSLWEKDAELLRLLRAAHTAVPRAPGQQQNLLAYAVAWNAPEQVRTLITAGSNPGEVLIPTVEDDFLNLLSSGSQRRMIAEDFGVTPLMLATALGYTEVMHALLEAGANPYAVSQLGVNAISLAGTQDERLKVLLAGSGKFSPPWQVKINLSDQRATFFQGDKLLMKTIISSGKPGFATPAGRYFVTEKARTKRSNLYDAEMPWFMRLNGSALGLHAGPTNGKPISHGCIRMPDGAARLLFEKAPVGTLVTITE